MGRERHYDALTSRLVGDNYLVRTADRIVDAGQQTFDQIFMRAGASNP